MSIYEVGILEDGKRLNLYKRHEFENKIRKIGKGQTEATEFLFASFDDATVRVYRIDESKLVIITMFKLTHPILVLWMHEARILMVSEWNNIENCHSVRALKFTDNFSKIQEEKAVIEPKDNLRIWSWCETADCGITLFDGNSGDLVHFKITYN